MINSLHFDPSFGIRFWVHVGFKGLELRQRPLPLLLAPLTVKGRSQLFLIGFTNCALQVLLVFSSPRHWGRSTGSLSLSAQETDSPRILFSFQREVQVKSHLFNQHSDFSFPHQPKSLRHSFGGLMYLHHHLHSALQDGLGAGTCVGIF